MAIAEIEAYTESTQTDLKTLLVTAIGSYMVKEVNLAAYRSAILAKADGELDTLTKIYRMVDQINNLNSDDYPI